MNQQVKDLIQKLGEAIHESVADSDAIADVVKEIKEQGFDVLLMLEATIGLNEADEESVEAEGPDGDEVADGPFTHNDLNFLKSLRITTEEEVPSADAGQGLELEGKSPQNESRGPQNIKQLPPPSDSASGPNEAAA